jgi:hypothetical protein
MRRKESNSRAAAEAGSNPSSATRPGNSASSSTSANASDGTAEKPSWRLVIMFCSLLVIYSVLALVFMTPLVFPR